MSGASGLAFTSFLRRHAKDDLPALARALPMGCLLNAANPTRSSQKGAWLVPLERRPEAAREVAAGAVVLGRDEGACDVVLAGPTISRLHAAVWAEGSSLYLEDLGSRTGTCLDGQRLRAGHRKSIRPDVVGDLVLGEEAWFFFGPPALHAYLQHLVAAPSSLPLEEPPPPPKVEAGTVTRPLSRRMVAAALAASTARPADHELPWRQGLAALEQLAQSVDLVEVVLSVSAEPVPVGRVASPADVARLGASLEPLRPVLDRLQARLRGSGFPVTLFERSAPPRAPN